MSMGVLLLLVVSAGDDAAAGKALFLDRCALCHGELGDGQGPLAVDLPLPPRNFRGERLKWGNSKRSVEETVTHGRSDVMPAFDEVLTRAEITQVAGYVWSLIPPALQGQPFDAESIKRPGAQRAFVVHQRGKKFTPTTLAAKVGDLLVFVNDDPFDHDVHEQAPHAPPIRSQKPRQWDRLVLSVPGTLVFGCAIHPTMRLQVEVTP